VQLDEATTALAGITARACDIHARYLAAVQRTGSQLEDAGNMAPPPPHWRSVEDRVASVISGADAKVS
jgi:hypothetical protein